MTINAISSSTTSFAGSNIGLDAEGQLALLVLEHQETQSKTAEQDKLLARQRYEDASDAQVAAMHAEADHVLLGALVQGVAAAGASTVQFVDIANDPCPQSLTKPVQEKPWGEAASAGVASAGPVLGRALGEAPAADDRADAQQESKVAARAQWQLDDANKAIEKADQARDKALDWLGAVNANQASAETGIIAGFA